MKLVHVDDILSLQDLNKLQAGDRIDMEAGLTIEKVTGVHNGPWMQWDGGYGIECSYLDVVGWVWR